MATITVTATINDPSGTALQGNAFVRFRLRNFDGFVPRVSGTSILNETQVDASPDVSGNVSQTLWPNNQIAPATTFYTVEFWNQGRITSSGNYIFNGDTNLNTAAQLNTPPVPPGFKLVLQHDGADNSSQSTLNLVSGAVTVTDLGGGSLQLNGGGPSFTSAGQGYFLGAQSFASVLDDNGHNAAATGVTNQIFGCDLILTSTYTIRKMASLCITGNGSAQAFTAGIYSYDGNTKLVDAGANAFDTTASQRYREVTLGAPVTVTPGIYRFVCGANGTTGGSVLAHELQTWLTSLVNGISLGSQVGSYTRIFTAANSLSAGALPATLGALTPLTNSNPVTLPAVIFQV